MNETIDGVHVNEIHRPFIHVSAHAKFSRKFGGLPHYKGSTGNTWLGWKIPY